MAIIVQKYGGSSVADIAKLRRVADRVMRTRQQGHDVVVVVSAMGDTTDELLGLAKHMLGRVVRIVIAVRSGKDDDGKFHRTISARAAMSTSMR